MLVFNIKRHVCPWPRQTKGGFVELKQCERGCVYRLVNIIILWGLIVKDPVHQQTLVFQLFVEAY